MAYSKHVNTKKTPQSRPVPGRSMVKNAAGGYGFQIDAWAQLRRFLVLGAEGGTYYAGEHELTQEAAKATVECIKADGMRAVKEIVDISVAGRAPKNDPAIFALALVTVHGTDLAKKAAYAAITKVCRIGTHLFQFCQAVQDLRGWSRGLRNGVGRFYSEREADSLALQLVKYRQRNGWTHKDVVRLAHPQMAKGVRNDLIKWTIGKAEKVARSPLVSAFLEAQALDKDLNADSAGYKPAVKRIVELAKELPWEALPTQALKVPDVWDALLPEMPITALIRNLGRLAALGLTDSNLSPATKIVATKLNDLEALRKGRVHPLNLLNALKTYGHGHGDRGSLSWHPVGAVKDALDEAFYLAFQAVEPTGKNWMLAVDVSPSMSGAQIAGLNLTACEAAAAMAMVAARTEKNYEVLGFCHGLVHLGITAKDRLETAIKRCQNSSWGGTDAAQPMLYAASKGLDVDVFALYTDNESWAGSVHAFQALGSYRKSHVKDARFMSVSMTANQSTLSDPSDPLSMDICGFDTATPAVMADFVRG